MTTNIHSPEQVV